MPQREDLQAAGDSTRVSLVASEDAVASAQAEVAAAQGAYDARLQAETEAQRVANHAREVLTERSQADYDAPEPATQKALLAAANEASIADSRASVATRYRTEAKSRLDAATKALGEAQGTRDNAAAAHKHACDVARLAEIREKLNENQVASRELTSEVLAIVGHGRGAEVPLSITHKLSGIGLLEVDEHPIERALLLRAAVSERTGQEEQTALERLLEPYRLDHEMAGVLFPGRVARHLHAVEQNRRQGVAAEASRQWEAARTEKRRLERVAPALEQVLQRIRSWQTSRPSDPQVFSHAIRYARTLGADLDDNGNLRTPLPAPAACSFREPTETELAF
jgi:hypothetical protein